MGLAGNMKLSTFLVGGLSLGVAAIAAGSVFWPDSPEPEPEPEPRTELVAAPQPAKADAPVEAKADEPVEAKTDAPDAAEPVGGDTEYGELAWVGKDIGSAKLKDVTRGMPYKINVYQDDGHATANRLKIDIDRDDKWDIKVTYGEDITRKVSSNDDENYDLEEIWDGSAWVSR